MNPDPLQAEIDRIVAEEVAVFEAMREDAQALIPQQPHGRQRLFLYDLKDEYEVMYGGAVGGMKSSALLLAALEHIHVPHYAALILRRTFKDLALPDAIMSRAKEWLIGKPGVRWDADNYTFHFDCKNGKTSTLTFGYMDTEVNKYRYQGMAVQTVCYDELTQFTESMYSYLFTRLRRPAIPCKHCVIPMAKTPNGVWVHADEAAAWKAGKTPCDQASPAEASLTEYSELYDVPLRMRSATNPGGEGHEWVKSRFIPEDYSGPEEERIWEKEGEEEDGMVFHTFFVPSRLEDNPFVDYESYLDGLGRMDRVTKRQLLYGDWAISPTGDCYFNIDSVALFEAREAPVGELMEIESQFKETALIFAQKPFGLLAVWKRPAKGRVYVIGCDTASGKDALRGEAKKADRDWSVANVRDLESGEQVARFRGQVSEAHFGEYWARLSKWYNGAYVVPAVTGGYGRAALNRAVQCGLGVEYIYRREDETGTPGRVAGSNGDVDLGFTETGTTRPTLYSGLYIAILEHAIETYDAVTINEYYSFITNKDGKPEARPGAKDDCVTADALSVKGIATCPQFIRAKPKLQGKVLPASYGQQGLTDQQKHRIKQEARMRNSMR